jgi:hypothetical protein
VRGGGGDAEAYPLSRDYSVRLPVRVHEGGFAWYTVEGD